MRAGGSHGAVENKDEIELDDEDEGDAAEGMDQGKDDAPEDAVEQQTVPDAVYGQLGARARLAQQAAGQDS